MTNREWIAVAAIMAFGVGLIIAHQWTQGETIKQALGINNGVIAPVGSTAVSPPVYFAPLAADASANPRNGVALSTGGYAPPVSGINAPPVSWTM